MDRETLAAGRTAANGSFTGPNTFTTFPRGRARLSATCVPKVGAAWHRTRSEPSYETFSTIPIRRMRPSSDTVGKKRTYLSIAKCVSSPAKMGFSVLVAGFRPREGPSFFPAGDPVETEKPSPREEEPRPVAP